MPIRSELINIAKLNTIFSANIELETSKHEFTDISHQNKQGFEDKKLSGTDFTAFQQNVCQSMAYSANLNQRSLLFSYLYFRVYFACYPPESFKIICLTCIWLKFVDTSFHSPQKPATKSFQAGPSFLPDLKKSLREAQNSPGTGTRQMIG